MKKISGFFSGIFSKIKNIKNKGVVVLFALQMLLCISAAVVAIVVAARVPAGSPPDGAELADPSLPESLSFCYITFDTDGGAEMSKQRVWRGDAPTEPREPKREGYYFLGWSYNGAPFDFTEEITEDITLKAVWSPLFDCVFEYGDGSESVVITCRKGDVLTPPKRQPSRDDAYFIGWYRGNEPWNFETPVSEAITLRPAYSTTAEITLSLGFSPFIAAYTTLDRAYTAGELKPVWAALSDRFDTVFKSHSSSGENRYESATSGGAELIFYDTNTLSCASDGELLNLRDYLDRMPSFRAYLEANPSVYLSLLSENYGKPIYALPLPSLYKYPSSLPLLNAEIIRALLDGEEDFVSTDTSRITVPKYFSTLSGYEVSAPFIADGEISNFVKPISRVGNIIDRMNYRLDIPTMAYIDGTVAVKELRDYIDECYGESLSSRSELFLGDNAMYDTDELVALLRCVMLNRETLGLGGDSRPISVSSYDELLVLCEMLFGARGISSESGSLYFDSDGTLYDSRAKEESYRAIELMRTLIAEGLVSVGGDSADSLLTLWQACGEDAIDGFLAVVPPLAYYPDFGEVTRFLQSVPMYSNGAFAISASVADDGVKLNALLSMLDFMYTDEGASLITLGGTAFSEDGRASAAADSLCSSLSGGNAVEFLTDYIGALTGNDTYIAYGGASSDKLAFISDALSCGILKSNTNLWDDDYLYSYVPENLPLTEYNERQLSSLEEEFGDFALSSDANIFVKLLSGTALDYGTPCDEYFRLSIGGSEYIKILRQAVGRLKAYYNSYLYS